MITTTAIQRVDSISPRSMHSDALGTYVQNEVAVIGLKLIQLRPYVAELWRRFGNGETILGCTTKKQFCEKVLHRDPRTVRFMLAGGNPNNKHEHLELADGAEIISARQAHTLKRIRAFGDFVMAGLMLEYLRCRASEETMDVSGMQIPTFVMIGIQIERRFCGECEWNIEGEPYQSWSSHFVPSGTPDPCEQDCELCLAGRLALAAKIEEDKRKTPAELRAEWWNARYGR